MMKHNPDFDVLPSPSGQNTSMPPKQGADLNLGPYSPRPVAMPHNAPPGDFVGLPSPDGQYPGHVGGSRVYGANHEQAHSAPPQKGASGDLDVLPTPSGQYQHAKSQDSAKDGGGMC